MQTYWYTHILVGTHCLAPMESYTIYPASPRVTAKLNTESDHKVCRFISLKNPGLLLKIEIELHLVRDLHGNYKAEDTKVFSTVI